MRLYSSSERQTGTTNGKVRTLLTTSDVTRTLTGNCQSRCLIQNINISVSRWHHVPTSIYWITGIWIVLYKISIACSNDCQMTVFGNKVYKSVGWEAQTFRRPRFHRPCGWSVVVKFPLLMLPSPVKPLKDVFASIRDVWFPFGHHDLT